MPECLVPECLAAPDKLDRWKFGKLEHQPPTASLDARSVCQAYVTSVVNLINFRLFQRVRGANTAQLLQQTLPLITARGAADAHRR